MLPVGCSDGKTDEPVVPEPPVVKPGEPDAPQEQVKLQYLITPGKQLTEISPYVYGLNVDAEFSHSKADPSRLVRFGGNRTTGYNWENNASNAGSDWEHYSDNWLVGTVAGSEADVPGSVVSTFASNCLNNNQMPLITLPMCYAVAADKNGAVAEGDKSRWKEVVARKEGAFSLIPDLTDDKVYVDECVNFLTQKAGGKGRIHYALDNEPDLWPHTHPRICPEQLSCEEFLNRTVEFASAIKEVDEQAKIFGFASYGFVGYCTFSEAPDWKALQQQNDYNWFIDYYLEQVAAASEKVGYRLVDVIDLHWYPEATGDHRIVSAEANTEKDKTERLQAPRTLWNEGYRENSWIGEWASHLLPLIPKIQASIDRYYPGTKLAFGEFQYGGCEDVTGTIALVDALGVFGKYGVYASCHWGHPGSYGLLAYNLYCNYDGNKSAYGDIAVSAEVDDIQNSSVYASLHKEGSKSLHLIVTNKHSDKSIAGEFLLDSSVSYTKAKVYMVEEGKAQIQSKGEVSVVGNKLTYLIPPLSVAHMVLVTD